MSMTRNLILAAIAVLGLVACGAFAQGIVIPSGVKEALGQTKKSSSSSKTKSTASKLSQTRNSSNSSNIPSLASKLSQTTKSSTNVSSIRSKAIGSSRTQTNSGHGALGGVNSGALGRTSVGTGTMGRTGNDSRHGAFGG